MGVGMAAVVSSGVLLMWLRWVAVIGGSGAAALAVSGGDGSSTKVVVVGACGTGQRDGRFTTAFAAIAAVGPSVEAERPNVSFSSNRTPGLNDDNNDDDESRSLDVVVVIAVVVIFGLPLSSAAAAVLEDGDDDEN
jgi:hypothetical protein